ncbi:hypothetical protein, partial [Mesorhizobium sp. B2-3-5]|uniref:hypothetical protein n=1 Tax=Mesorhizobium sp. B2-3-5 TaxID=2589958 RepID=UPI001AED7351
FKSCPRNQITKTARQAPPGGPFCFADLAPATGSTLAIEPPSQIKQPAWHGTKPAAGLILGPMMVTNEGKGTHPVRAALSADGEHRES